MPADWKPRSAKKNRKLLRQLHLERGRCALSNVRCSGRIEIHHILGGAYGRDDHVSNIVKCCSFHHALITANDVEARVELGQYLLRHRLDVIEYVRDRFIEQGPEAGDEWLATRLFIERA